MFSRIVGAYYHPVILYGTAVTNSAWCAYFDTQYGVVKNEPIFEGCSGNSHVFVGSSITYGLRPLRIIASAVAGVIAGPISTPLFIYNRTKANPARGMMDGCLCGRY